MTDFPAAKFPPRGSTVSIPGNRSVRQFCLALLGEHCQVCQVTFCDATDDSDSWMTSQMALALAAPARFNAAMSSTAYISKSKFLHGLQCTKLLWCDYNAKHLFPEVDDNHQAKFDQGHDVGALAKRMFPDGIEIDVHRITSE